MPSGTFWTVKLLDGYEVDIVCYSIGHIHIKAFELQDIQISWLLPFYVIYKIGSWQVQYFIHQGRHQTKSNKWRHQSLAWNRSQKKELSVMWWASLQLVITNQNNWNIIDLSEVTSYFKNEHLYLTANLTYHCC